MDNRTQQATHCTLRAMFTGTALVAAVLLAANPAAAQPPAGYYDTVDTTNATTLRQTLHPVIDDHTRYPYTASTTDTWDILNLADEDPNNPSNIIDIYKNASYTKISGGVGAYNREHTWPKSYGFPNDGDDNSSYTDCHHLMLSDVAHNSSRSNKPFRDCTAGCTEETTLFNDGRGGGSGVYPGNSNWTTGDFTQGTWETWNGRKGDVARAIFYMDIRYEGGTHGTTGFAEPDLIITDNESLIDASNTGSNESVAYMGMLSVLLQWHAQDPVDSRELFRNEVVYMFQGNRNPFIDHPEWVDCLHGSTCGGGGTPDTTPPAAPTGLAATGGDGTVNLTWSANGESDLAGYNVYRSTAAGGPYTKLNGPLVSVTSYSDATVTNGTTYFYIITAVDTSSNISSDSAEASATPQSGGGGGGGGGNVILSEVFYDPSGNDTGLEWVELYNAGSTTVDLSGYSLGYGGTSYTYGLLQLAGSIAPGATFVVGGPTSSSANGNPNFNQAVDFSPDIQNSGSTADGVALFDSLASQVNSTTVPVDAVLYGSTNNNGLLDETGVANGPEVGDAPSNSSIERTDLAGSWQIQSAPTPNATPFSGGGGGGGSGTVILSEVLYDISGTDTGLEWVELHNAGSTTVDLSGYSLGYGGTDYTYSVVQLSGSIAPGATFVVGGPTSGSSNSNPSFNIAADFNPDIQNSGSTADGVALFDVLASQVGTTTVPVDAVLYGSTNSNGLIDETGVANAPEVGDAPSNSSIERIDLAGNWQIQSSPTPNTTPLGGGGGGGGGNSPTTVTFTSIAGEDGWVRESSENSNVGGSRSSTSSSSSALRGGDNRSDRQYKGIISFDTSTIPSGATLVSATLRLRRGTKVGTSPFSTHGTCRVDIKTGGFGSSTALATEDFQAAATATQVASLSNAVSNLDWSEGSLDASGLAAVNTGGTTQLRFYFDLDDNDDRGNDYIGYYSGDNSTSANRPQLVITYQ